MAKLLRKFTQLCIYVHLAIIYDKNSKFLTLMIYFNQLIYQNWGNDLWI